MKSSFWVRSMPVQLPRGKYYGRNLSSREMAGLILTEKVHPVGEPVPPHAHRQPYICFVLEGSWREQFEGGDRTCRPRTLVYHPPGEVHSDDFSAQSGRVFTIEMDDRWRDYLDRLTPVLGRSHQVAGGTVAATVDRIYDESRRRDRYAEVVVEGLMLELIGMLGRTSSSCSLDSAPRWLRSAEEILHREFRTHPEVVELASFVGVHPVHLSRAFRARHGCSISEHVRRLRIEYACDALATTNSSLAEIAYDAGFADQSHFTNTFRRITGVTPGRFRASHLPPDLSN